MANPYFKFKNFTVYHDRCAMKVGTDGVLIGAWTQIGLAKNALDIGTGTGLIALMLSQRSINQLSIDAIDIDEDTIEQAIQNVERSGFKDINCKHISLQDYIKVCDEKYDLIVSNPPYFNSSLCSPNNQRNLARHTTSLYLTDFMNLSSQLLSDEGKLSIIFPYADKKMLVSLSEKYGLFLSRITNVYPTPSSQPKRVLLEFSKKDGELSESDLVIERFRHLYTEEFAEMVKNFYLNL